LKDIEPLLKSSIKGRVYDHKNDKESRYDAEMLARAEKEEQLL